MVVPAPVRAIEGYGICRIFCPLSLSLQPDREHASDQEDHTTVFHAIFLSVTLRPLDELGAGEAQCDGALSYLSNKSFFVSVYIPAFMR